MKKNRKSSIRMKKSVNHNEFKYEGRKFTVYQNLYDLQSARTGIREGIQLTGVFENGNLITPLTESTYFLAKNNNRLLAYIYNGNGYTGNAYQIEKIETCLTEYL